MKKYRLLFAPDDSAVIEADWYKVTKAGALIFFRDVSRYFCVAPGSWLTVIDLYEEDE